MIRRLLVIAEVWVLGLSACSGSSNPPASADVVSTASTVTTVRPVTTDTSPIITTSTIETPPTTSSPPYPGPDLVVASPDGVFRIVDGVAIRILDRVDVSWVADDGMGGVVFYADPGVIEHLAKGASWPVVLHEMASPNYVTLVQGRPTLVMSVLPAAECPEGDGVHSVLLDLESRDERTFMSCIPLESSGLHPQTMGGRLAVAVDGGGWPQEAPVWARLIFRELDGSEAVIGTNPRPTPCAWCVVEPRLSPDGRILALLELIPSPSDLGAADWEAFEALDIVEQWRRWERARKINRVLRTIDLSSGETLFEDAAASMSSLAGFDGRFVLGYSMGSESQSTTPHLIDTIAALEIPIDLAGIAQDSASTVIGLFLPEIAIEDVKLRSDGLGAVRFGDAMGDAMAVLEVRLGEPDENDSGPWIGGATFWMYRWVDAGLTVIFSDAPYYRDDGAARLFQWTYSGRDFTTVDGLGVGATVEDLRAAYGDRLTVTDFADCGVSRNELLLDDAIGFNFGAGDPGDPDSRVEQVFAGAAPSCY